MTTPKRGRPTVGVPVLVRIPADMLAEVDQYADECDLSRAEIVRQAVRLWLDT